MEELKKLEYKRLLKELDFIQTDFSYKVRLSEVSKKHFDKIVNSIIKENKELESIIKKEEDSSVDYDKNETIKGLINKKNSQTKEIKSLYRKIVKVTHPDIIKNKFLNQLYVKATDYYESSDIVGIYQICDSLEIDYQVEDLENILEKIKLYKNKLKLIESAYHWKWFKSENSKEKDKIILEYIERNFLN